MTTHWMAGIAKSKPRMICGNATFTDESNGTTSVPSPTIKTPNPGCRAANPPDRDMIPRSERFRHDFSDRLFQRRRGLEANRLAGFHFDRLTRPRIQTLPGLRLPHRERSETRQCELAALLQFLDDRVHQIAGRAIGRGTRQLD